MTLISKTATKLAGVSPGVTGGVVAAAALAGMALFVQSRARKAEREHPPQGRFIEVDGVRLHYVVHGDGPPVVLLHGNGVTTADYELSGVVERLRGSHRVILIDRPGFGFSERPRSTVWTPVAQANLLHTALTRLGIERPIVVGHSWGTLVALAMALEHPEHVRGLALLSGYYFPSLRLQDLPLMPPAIPVLGDILRYTISPLLGRAMKPLLTRKLFRPGPIPARFRHFPYSLSLRPSQLRASAGETALMVPAAAGLAKRYGELAMPVVIMAGKGDKIVDTQAQSVRLGETIPGAEVIVSDRAGHMLHYIEPDEIAAAIARLGDRAAALRPGPEAGEEDPGQLAA